MTLQQCGLCGAKNDALTAVNHDDAARAGDVTICYQCGAVGFIEADLSIRLATDDELRILLKSETGRLIRDLVRMARLRDRDLAQRQRSGKLELERLIGCGLVLLSVTGFWLVLGGAWLWLW